MASATAPSSPTPWPERGGGKIKRGADRHYPLMKVSDIIGMAHAVRQLAKERSHLYLWTTNNHLPSAFLVMWAWGFEYKTALTWMKTGNAGMGQYHQGLTEHVLFGVRGKPRKYRTLNGKRARGLTGFFQEPRGRHSKKPDIVYKWARQVSYGPYLELFGIGERPGWREWGNQIWKKRRPRRPGPGAPKEICPRSARPRSTKGTAGSLSAEQMVSRCVSKPRTFLRPVEL